MAIVGNYALKKLLPKAFVSALRNPAWICFTWFGLTAGISLLEAPVKFTAPLLTRPVALDVGRVVFAALNKAELALLVILLILVRISAQYRKLLVATAILTLIVLAQSFWLLPELSQRALMIASGTEPAASPAHAAYAVLELVKLGLLLFLGFRTLKSAQDF